METEDKDKALFNQIVVKYSRKDSVLSSMIARKSMIFQSLTPLLKQTSNLGVIVDVGCGIAAPAQYLTGHYERYIGIDHSEEMIDAAKRAHQHIGNVEFLAENIKSHNLPENVADLVFVRGALHHMTDLDEVMSALRHIAKRNAYLCAIEPQNANPLIQLARFVRKKVDKSYSEDQLFFSEKQLRELFEKNRVEIVSVDYQGFFGTPFAEVIMQPQFIITPMSRFAVKIDSWFKTHLPPSLKTMSFNIVLIGIFR